jgi:hypothetical protein
MTNDAYNKAAGALVQLAQEHLPQLKNDLAQLVGIAEDTATRALSPNEAKDLHPGDGIPLELAQKHLRPAYNALSAILDWQNPIVATLAYAELVNLAAAFFEIGIRATVTESAKKYFDNRNTRRMRDSRANSCHEQALLAAIKAVRGNGPVTRPAKEANAILDAVNRRLESNGNAPVKLDVIRRRLKNPRS